MCNARRAIIAKWCSSGVLAYVSTSPSVGDPPAFDQDRDGLTILEVSENKIVVEHAQRAGLESMHRFSMVAEHGHWIVDQVQILEEDSPKNWVPMIL